MFGMKFWELVTVQLLIAMPVAAPSLLFLIVSMQGQGQVHTGHSGPPLPDKPALPASHLRALQPRNGLAGDVRQEDPSGCLAE